MTRDALLAGLHWFWVFFFFAFGVYLIWQRDHMGRVRAACRCFAVVAGADSAGTRIGDAVARRQEAEGAPPPTGWWIGAVSILLSILAAFSHVPVGLLYALLCLTMAVVTGAAFLHLRNTQRKRVAVLSPRAPEGTISPLWFLLSVVCAVSILVYLGDPVWALPAALVCASALGTTLIAWRLTELGAILSGVDLPAEQAVDDRLRLYRSSIVLMFALIQPFVFASQITHRSGIEDIAFFVPAVAWITFFFWMLWRQRAAVRLA